MSFAANTFGRARVAVALLAAVAGTWLPGGVWLPTRAAASTTVKLSARFAPDRLGADTTILIDLHVAAPAGQLPSPVTGIQLRLPAGTFVATSTLGLETCNPAVLAAHGVGACPADSVMGYGKAIVAVPLGPESVYESAGLTLLAAPEVGGHTAISFFAEGSSPVIAQLVFPGTLFGDTGLYGSRLNVAIPPIDSLPGTPPGSLISIKSSIGPKGVTYYRKVGRRVTPYAPHGFIVPPRCPPGGFPFAASFTFEDGADGSATATAPCPSRVGPHERGRSRRVRPTTGG